MKPYYFLFAGLLALCPTLTWGARTACVELVSREPLSQAAIRTRIGAYSETVDFLIRQLEIEHLIFLREGEPGSSKYWLKFGPLWAVQGDAAVERIAKYFQPGTDSPQLYSGGVQQWVLEWEGFYQEIGGVLAPSWERSGRRRFVQKVLVYAAVLYAIEAESQGGAPLIFTYQEGAAAEVTELHAQIGVAFRGETDKFQAQFDSLYRRKTGNRLRKMDSLVSAETVVQKGQAAIGRLRSRLKTQPVVRRDRKDREKKTDVELAVEALRSNPDAAFPLACLVAEFAGGNLGDNPYEVWEKMFELRGRHGSTEKYFIAINDSLAQKGLPILEPSESAKTLSEELVIEVAVVFLSGHSKEIQEQFLREEIDLQGSSRDQPLYFDLSNISELASLGADDLNFYVRARLGR